MLILGKLFTAIVIITTAFFLGHDVPGETDVLGYIPAILADVKKLPKAYDQALSIPKGSSIAILLDGNGESGGELTLTITSQPGHGTLSGDAPNLTYNPQSGYTGKDHLAFTISNDYGISEPQTLIYMLLTRITISRT